jgi:2-succinyl-5-enolpyruvyl-6-hydroxy-3-cyclohexene-1-carboxylate synthase
MSSTTLTGWARLLVHSLAEAGVREVVASPGSRSTPFLAAIQAHPRLRLWSATDERCAGFFALGHGRWSGCPSLLLCTSGTAGAHYLPAVLEAEAAGVPLLVLTADRPGELVDCGAPQTIDQIGLFGRHVRSFVELGVPEPHPAALRGLRRRAVQAVSRTRWPEPGPVHLNARARKPLEPSPTRSDDDVSSAVDAIFAEAVPLVHLPSYEPDADGVRRLCEAIASEESGLVVCGAAALEQRRSRDAIFELARRSGYPLVADAASQLRFTGPVPEGVVRLAAASSLFESGVLRARHRPRVVVQVGRAPLFAAWEAVLDEAPECRRFVLSDGVWHDPQNRAVALLFGDLDRTLTALLARLSALERGRTAWALALEEADRETAELVASACDGPELVEGAVARLAVATLPAGSLLAVGNSLPIRQVERFAAGIDAELGVWAQRGANGIDGLVSGFAGTLSLAQESAHPPPCALLLVGDLSLLHDLGGLALARRTCRLPLVVVVVNNDGGRIFEQLPIAEMPGTDLEPWTTPHGLDFEGAARLFRLPYAHAGTAEELRRILVEARERGGASLVEVRVDPHSARRQSDALRRAIVERFGGDP